MAILLLRYAEIGLKSAPVRKKFENQLKDNMLTMLMEDGVEALITKKGARYYVEATDPDAAVRSLRKVFGVASISVAETCSSKMEDICATAAEYSLSRLSEGQSFAVDARREGSQGYTSMDVGREAGSAIFIANEDKGVKVDLTNPEVKFFIEVRDNQAYIFQDYVRCHAGLPIGSQGRVLAYVDDDRGLVSAWMMMKRGCRAVVKGSGDVESLRQYDPLMKVTESDYPRNILGYVMGHDLDDLEGFDASAYEFPVFFPTVGMTDEQVSEYAEMIRNGL